MMPRAARPQEIQGAAELAQEVFRKGKPVTMGDLFPLLFNADNAENIRIIEDGGRILSHIGMWFSEIVTMGIRIKSASIGAVCTKDEARGQGLGTALLMDSFRHARENGVDIITISGGRGLYTSNECRFVGKEAVYKPELAERLALRSSLKDFRIRLAKSDENHIIKMLYSAEPIRFSRSSEDFDKVIDAAPYPGCHDWLQEIYIISRHDIDVSYIAVMRPPGNSDRVRVFEYAGDRSGVAFGISIVAENLGGCDLEIQVPQWDTSLITIMASHQITPQSVRALSGTHYLPEPRRLFSQLYPYLLENLEKPIAKALANPLPYSDGGLRFVYRDDSYTLESRSAVTDLVFGTDATQTSLESAPGDLCKAIAAVFPIALPNPEGLTYI